MLNGILKHMIPKYLDVDADVIKYFRLVSFDN